MLELTASQVLGMWDAARGQHPLERSLTLLAAADPGWRPEELARLSLGQRDRMLLTLRDAIFGSTLEAYAECEACGAGVELELSCAELLSRAGEPGGQRFELSHGDQVVEWRLPSTEDLIAVRNVVDIEEARQLLARRCLLTPVEAALSAPLLAELGSLMQKEDPGAEFLLKLRCPECAHAWQSALEIDGYVWSELERLAWRLADEVHTLATTYGWGELEILTLSSSRRQLYLSMVHA